MPLDRKAVEAKGKELTKAAAGGEGSAVIVPLLSQLRNGVQATEELLRSTRIGMIVNRLKAHKDPAVQTTASEIVAKWKADVKKTGSGASTPRPTANGTSSPAPVPSPAASAKGKRKHTVPPERRNVSTDNVNYKVTGNSTRDNCVKMMYDALAFMSEECKWSPFELVTPALSNDVFALLRRL
jgi:transcription elongation factor S-II